MGPAVIFYEELEACAVRTESSWCHLLRAALRSELYQDKPDVGEVCPDSSIRLVQPYLDEPSTPVLPALGCPLQDVLATRQPWVATLSPAGL